MHLSAFVCVLFQLHRCSFQMLSSFNNFSFIGVPIEQITNNEQKNDKIDEKRLQFEIDILIGMATMAMMMMTEEGKNLTFLNWK